MSHLLQNRVGNDNRGTRWELAQILDRIAIEVDLVGNAVPHMCLGPPGHSLDVQIVIDIDVVRGAIAAAGAAAERKGRYQIVIHTAQGTYRTRGVYDDPAG